MKYTLILFASIILITNSYSQDFFDTDFNTRKKYILLTNPTVRNLQTTRYLKDAKLLDINNRKTKFVGVYYAGQKYDFSETKQYIEEQNLENFFLHEITGELNENNLFANNECSQELKKIFENSIGVFFFGGPDIPPNIYGEKNTLSLVTDKGRHFFEATFLFHLLGGFQNENYKAYLEERPKYVITGFCLGMQTMNVATGGTLIQDIPSEIYDAHTAEEKVKLGRKNLHRNYWQNIINDSLLMGINLHTITFTDHPFFGEIVNVKKRWEPRIYSSHHQAPEKLGKGMVVTAISPDGKIIEGLAHNKYPNVFAVQFHPEVPALYEDMYKRKFHPEDEPMSYNKIIGKQSVRFHEKYWEHISYVFKKAKKNK
jgi:putative glutamine amidotransferase